MYTPTPQEKALNDLRKSFPDFEKGDFWKKNSVPQKILDLVQSTAVIIAATKKYDMPALEIINQHMTWLYKEIDENGIEASIKEKLRQLLIAFRRCGGLNGIDLTKMSNPNALYPTVSAPAEKDPKDNTQVFSEQLKILIPELDDDDFDIEITDDSTCYARLMLEKSFLKKFQTAMQLLGIQIEHQELQKLTAPIGGASLINTKVSFPLTRDHFNRILEHSKKPVSVESKSEPATAVNNEKLKEKLKQLEECKAQVLQNLNKPYSSFYGPDADFCYKYMENLLSSIYTIMRPTYDDASLKQKCQQKYDAYYDEINRVCGIKSPQIVSSYKEATVNKPAIKAIIEEFSTFVKKALEEKYGLQNESAPPPSNPPRQVRG